MKHKLCEYALRYGYFSKDRPLIGYVTENREDVEVAAEFLHLAEKVFHHPQEKDEARAEILAKIVAYRELKEGMKIETYNVEKVFNLWHEMPAFGLVSENEPPILLFRGTDLRFHRKKALASILSDFDLKGPGLFVFKKSRSVLHRWIKERSPRAVGFSLGGALASYMLIFEKDEVSKIKPSYAFNAPGLYAGMLKQWNEIPRKPPLISIVNEGDFISKIGTQIGNIKVYPKQFKPLKAHTALLCAEFRVL